MNYNYEKTSRPANSRQTVLIMSVPGVEGKEEPKVTIFYGDWKNRAEAYGHYKDIRKGNPSKHATWKLFKLSKVAEGSYDYIQVSPEEQNDAPEAAAPAE